MACCCYPYFVKVRDYYYCKNIYYIHVVKLNSLLTIGLIWLSVLYASTDPQFNCTVRFLQTTLSVPESVGTISVCTTVEGSISGEATAMVTTRNGTATGTCTVLTMSTVQLKEECGPSDTLPNTHSTCPQLQTQALFQLWKNISL